MVPLRDVGSGFPGGRELSKDASHPRQGARWFATSIAIAFVFLALWRERHAEGGPRRIWGELSTFLEALGATGQELTLWGNRHFSEVATVLVLAAFAMGVVLLWSRKGLGSIFLWWVAALGSALFGQWAAGNDHARLNAVGYGSAICLAAWFGWRAREETPRNVPELTFRDFRDALMLVVVATFLRLWALNELPGAFEGEMGISMLAGTSWYGLQNYLVDALTTVSVGCMHLFVQLASFSVLGDSVFALRVSAVVIGVATIWNLFWLMRQNVGRQGAWCAAVLATCGAEQLWWSRNENTYFIAVCLAGVVTARLAAWLLESPRLLRALTVAVWLGITRLFYLAAGTLFALPPLVMLHAVIFTRVRRRRFLAVLAVLLLGIGLWAASLSLVSYTVHGEWRWIHPALHGELVAKENQSLVDRLASIGKRALGNAAEVGRQWTMSAVFTQWYQRNTWPYPPTTMNVGMVILGALGLGVACGRIRDPFAALLLAWLCVGLAPGLLSAEPADRRVAAAFPAWYALAGYGWQQVRDWLGNAMNRPAALVWSAVSWTVLLAVSVASLGSHLTLEKAEVGLAALGRATRSAFEKSNAIYYEMDEAALPLVVMTHSRAFRERLPCVQTLAPRTWLSALIEQPCSFSDPVWSLLVSPAELEVRQRNTHLPEQFTVLLGRVPEWQRKRATMRRLFPNLEERNVETLQWSYTLTVATIRRRDLEALARPELVERSLEPEEREAAETSGAVPDCATEARAAIFAPEDGWYWIQPSPEGKSGLWRLAGASLGGAAMLPLTAGFHPVEFRGRVPCGMIPKLGWRRDGEPDSRVVQFWAPWLSAEDLVRATPIATYAGYERAGCLGETRGQVQVIDASVAEQMRVVTLVRDEQGYQLVEMDANGQVSAARRLDIPGAVVVNGFSAGPQGAYLVHTEDGVVIADRDGVILHRWPPHRSPVLPNVVWWPGGTIVAAMPGAAQLWWLDIDGTVRGVEGTFAGGPGKFFEPTAVAYDAVYGRLAVAEVDGRILVLQVKGSAPTNLEFLFELRPGFGVARQAVRAFTFDSEGRLWVADPFVPRLFVYNAEGRRLMAARPEHDWEMLLREVGSPQRIVPRDSDVLVVAGGTPWVFGRRTEFKPVVNESGP